MADEPADIACTEVVEIVTDYLEGSLSPGRAHAFEHHLATCPGCTEYVEQMRTLAGSLGGIAEQSLSPDQRAGLMAALRELRDR
jgi:anti-sigma factor RsiW